MVVESGKGEFFFFFSPCLPTFEEPLPLLFSLSLSLSLLSNELTSISSFAALSRASLSILSMRSASLRRPLAYVWKVPLPAPAAEPCTLDTIVGTFWVMKASFFSSSSA